MRADGTGINGSLLILPVEGNLPDTPAQTPRSELRSIIKRLERLESILLNNIVCAPKSLST